VQSAPAPASPVLAMPKAPADVFGRIDELGPVLAVTDGVDRPAGGTLSGVLDAHREVIPAGHMINGPCARDLSQRRGAAGEDLGDMRLAISRAPHAAHEDRFAFLTCTTEEELADVGDPEC